MTYPTIVSLPSVRIRATFDAHSWPDECSPCDTEALPGVAQDPVERGGWVDPSNPWGSFEQDRHDHSCKPTELVLPINEAVEFLRDFPGGIWDYSDSESVQDFRTGEWKSVTAHIDGDGAATVLELLDTLG